MHILGVLDRRDYDPHARRVIRRAARGIIFLGGGLLLVRSEKYGEYKFPGGGIEAGESDTQALMREVREETGYTVLPAGIREYGAMIERRRDRLSDAVYEHPSLYFFCEVSPLAGERSLDSYEAEYGYTVQTLPLEAAIAANEAIVSNPEPPWTARELFVLKTLRERIRTQ